MVAFRENIGEPQTYFSLLFDKTLKLSASQNWVEVNSQAPVPPCMKIGPVLRRSSLWLASYLKAAKNDSAWNLISLFSKTSLAVLAQWLWHNNFVKKFRSDYSFYGFYWIPNVKLTLTHPWNLFFNEMWKMINVCKEGSCQVNLINTVINKYFPSHPKYFHN